MGRLGGSVPALEGGPALLSSSEAVAGPRAPGNPGVPCAHPIQEDLGVSSGASYALCLTCGAVLVFAKGSRWVIPPVDPRDPRDTPAVVAPPFSNYP